MSDRTSKLYGYLRTRILDFDPDGADSTLRSSLTGGLHTHSPPDNAPTPYGFLLLNARRGSQEDSDTEEEGQIELMFVGRGRAQFTTVERAMDIAEEALLNLNTDSIGWSFTVRSLLIRHTMPWNRQPANAEMIQVRAVWRYTWWPTYRSQYAVPAGTPAP